MEKVGRVLNLKYKINKLKNKLLKVKSQKVGWSDTLALAAKEHCKCHTEGKCYNHIGIEDGTTPADRVAKFGTAVGLDDYIVPDAADDFDAVIRLLLNEGPAKFFNG